MGKAGWMQETSRGKSPLSLVSNSLVSERIRTIGRPNVLLSPATFLDFLRIPQISMAGHTSDLRPWLWLRAEGGNSHTPLTHLDCLDQLNAFNCCVAPFKAPRLCHCCHGLFFPSSCPPATSSNKLIVCSPNPVSQPLPIPFPSWPFHVPPRI
jgi:hypothetical protein